MRVITHQKVVVRFISLWLIGLTILFILWSFSYTSLPEGSASGSVIVAYIPLVAEEANSTFIRIFLYNLLVAGGLLTIANLIKIRGYPLGYIIIFYHWALYGVFLGTNSFMLPAANRLLPSLTTLFHGSGVYEITSYTMIAASTYNLGVSLENVGSNWRNSLLGKLKLSKAEAVTLILAVIILAVANYFEAWQIFHA